MEQADNFSKQYNIFNTLFDRANVNSFLILDEKGIIKDINHGFTKHFGYEHEDLAGKKFDMLFTNEDRNKGLPDKELKNTLDLGQANDMNFMLKKDKTKVWVSGESILVKNEGNEKFIVKIIQNIHFQKKSERLIERIKSFGEIILKTIDDAVLIIDNNMNIIKSNKAFDKLFYINLRKNSPENFGALIKPFDEHNHLKNQIAKAFDGKASFRNSGLTIKTPQDEMRSFDVSSAIIEEEDLENKLLIVIHDITLSKHVEAEKDDMIGFVVHELRNPLSNISLCNSIIEDCINDSNLEDVKGLLERSNNNVTRLGKMITELYNTTQISSGNFNLNISVFNIDDLLNEAVNTVQQLNADFIIEINGHTNFEITGDKFKLVEVLVNYLSNAIKYSNNQKRISITVLYEEGSVTFSVRDYGLGINPEHLPYVFNRFFRAEKTKNLEGIGLGLYLCRRVINAHDGRVWAESKEGEGSTFYFCIPLINILSHRDASNDEK
ncbi:MAG: ATP-binding protein [Ginsengibacter sp.]